MTQTDLASKEPLAALRQEIRRAGTAARQLRIEIPLFLAGMAVVCLAGIGPNAPYFAALYLLCVGGAIVWAGGYRRFREQQLLRHLAPLSVEQRRRVLAPLRGETTGDTDRFVGFLERELNSTSELTPAAAPDGTGAELAAEAGSRPRL